MIPGGIRRVALLEECLYGMQHVQERFSPQGMSEERASVTSQTRVSGFLLSISVVELTQPHIFNHDEGSSPLLGWHAGLLHHLQPCFALRSTQLVTLPYPVDLALCAYANTRHRPLCQKCPNDHAICCPLTVDCTADGHCPLEAVIAAGWTIGGEDVDGHRAGGVEITN